MAHSQGGHKVHYGWIFFLLCICTGLSWLADVAQQREWLHNWLLISTIVMAVAVAKALFVLTYFMHLKFEGKWKFVLLAPTAILAIGLPLALLPDIGLHYYINAAPQVKNAPVQPIDIEGDTPVPEHD